MQMATSFQGFKMVLGLSRLPTLASHGPTKCSSPDASLPIPVLDGLCAVRPSAGSSASLPASPSKQIMADSCSALSILGSLAVLLIITVINVYTDRRLAHIVQR